MFSIVSEISTKIVENRELYGVVDFIWILRECLVRETRVIGLAASKNFDMFSCGIQMDRWKLVMYTVSSFTHNYHFHHICLTYVIVHVVYHARKMRIIRHALLRYNCCDNFRNICNYKAIPPCNNSQLPKKFQFAVDNVRSSFSDS